MFSDSLRRPRERIVRCPSSEGVMTHRWRTAVLEGVKMTTPTIPAAMWQLVQWHQLPCQLLDNTEAKFRASLDNIGLVSKINKQPNSGSSPRKEPITVFLYSSRPKSPNLKCQVFQHRVHFLVTSADDLVGAGCPARSKQNTCPCSSASSPASVSLVTSRLPVTCRAVLCATCNVNVILT